MTAVRGLLSLMGDVFCLGACWCASSCNRSVAVWPQSHRPNMPFFAYTLTSTGLQDGTPVAPGAAAMLVPVVTGALPGVSREQVEAAIAGRQARARAYA